MKKKLLFALMLIAAVVIMPRVHAAITLGEVTDITNSDTLKGDKPTQTVTNTSDYSNVTITYDSGKFKLLPSTDSSEGDRPDGYAWIGFHVAQPTGPSSINYTVSFNGGAAGNSISCSNSGFDDYIGFKVSDLEAAVKDAKKLQFSYVITWTDGNGESATQTINVVINPEKIILLAEDDETEDNTQLWNNATYQAEVASVMDKLYDDLDATIYVAEHYDFSNYTAESIKAVEEAVAAAKAAGKDLTTNNQAAVIALRNAITNAITNLVVKGDESVKPGSTNTDTSKPGEQAPDTFDAGLVYMGLALSAVGASVVSIKKLKNN